MVIGRGVIARSLYCSCRSQLTILKHEAKLCTLQLRELGLLRLADAVFVSLYPMIVLMKVLYYNQVNQGPLCYDQVNHAPLYYNQGNESPILQ